MDLSQRQEVRDLIREEVQKCNTTLPSGIRVCRFALLSKELDADDAEMTRTRKVRRNYVTQKYADVIEAFYSGQDEAELAATVTYEDGRQAIVRARLQMVDVEAAAGAEAPHV
jgi:long-chain acyl-CoA synthetase